MNELLKALPSFVGVVVGGLITFSIQLITIRRQQKWDRNKMEIDNFYKEQTTKFQTFNNILQLNGPHEIFEHKIHYGAELNDKNYTQYIRSLLFNIFHLLDEK